MRSMHSQHPRQLLLGHCAIAAETQSNSETAPSMRSTDDFSIAGRSRKWPACIEVWEHTGVAM